MTNPSKKNLYPFLCVNNIKILNYFHHKKIVRAFTFSNKWNSKYMFEKFNFYLWFFRENTRCKAEICESSRILRMVYDLRTSFSSHLAYHLETRGTLCLSFHLLKITKLLANPLPMDSKIPEHRWHRFRFAKHHTDDGYRQSSLVPKSSPVSTYSFLTVDCAM